jgi:ABC-type dipeptide/oligopeptide/nickel transport system permease subunit
MYGLAGLYFVFGANASSGVTADSTNNNQLWIVFFSLIILAIFVFGFYLVKKNK